MQKSIVCEYKEGFGVFQCGRLGVWIIDLVGPWVNCCLLGKEMSVVCGVVLEFIFCSFMSSVWSCLWCAVTLFDIQDFHHQQ